MHIRATVRRVWREHGVRGVATLLRYYVLRVLTTLAGPGRTCPICGWQGREFVPVVRPEYGVVRPKALCPSCGALERHRAYAPYYREFFRASFASSPTARRPDVLFFAPDECLEKAVAGSAGSYRRSNYQSQDPRDLSLDLHDLALPSESVDLVVMNHVLSCVADDRRAAANLYRVLRPGGLVIAGEQVRPGATTRDPPRPGYGGVWRSYGRADIAERFHPFAVEVVDTTSAHSAEQRSRFGLAPAEYVLLLRKEPGGASALETRDASRVGDREAIA
jgi:SAM-dependent methyltransferase